MLRGALVVVMAPGAVPDWGVARSGLLLLVCRMWLEFWVAELDLCSMLTVRAEREIRRHTSHRAGLGASTCSGRPFRRRLGDQQLLHRSCAPPRVACKRVPGLRGVLVGCSACIEFFGGSPACVGRAAQETGNELKVVIRVAAADLGDGRVHP